MTKKTIRLILIELIALSTIIISTLFKFLTDSIFFPEIKIIILFGGLGLILLGFGIWFEKL